MSMDVLVNPNGIKIYNVGIGKNLPEWISEKQKKALKDDLAYRRRLELIQDFNFKVASQRIKASKDQEFLVSTGTYPPQIKVYELSQLTMKFERHLDCEVVQFQILSDNYSKLVFLRADRTLELHAQFGNYDSFRVPRAGRDLMYHPPSCDLIICGASSEIWRFNLEQGQFLNSLQSNLPGVNVCHMNPVHQLFGFGGENPVVECWDPRSKRKVGQVSVENHIDAEDVDPQISALKFDSGGINLVVGTNSGHCLLYDIRTSKPLLVKDHQYGYPIKSIDFQEDKILSVDSKILKIWNRDSGKVEASIEPPANINEMCLFPNSGLILFACEQPKLLAYFIPHLGPAPKWCSFLENLTEELEEDEARVYDDYKFVTREELESMGLSKMIGTEYLKAYMHGFFMDIRLYNKLRAAGQPFEYENYRKERIKQKLENEAETRIGTKKKMPKVNAKLAARISSDSKKKELLEDERFSKKMFENPDFEVDEQHEKYKFYRPTESKKNISQQDLEEMFDRISSSEGEDGSSDEESSSESEDLESEKVKKSEKNQKKPDFYELKQGQAFDLTLQTKPSIREKELPFAKRISQLKDLKPSKTVKNSMTGKESSFVLRKEKKRESQSKKRREEWAERLSERRGVQQLKLSKPPKRKHF